MKQSGTSNITGLKDGCPLLQFIDQVSMFTSISTRGMLNDSGEIEQQCMQEVQHH